ncbi:hypothetical protein [Blastococcus sp. SYSU DS0973]
MDLLLSTTGSGRLTRFLPVLRSDAAATYGSIMAYRSAAGPVRLAAFPERAGILSDPGPVAGAADRGAVAFTLAAAIGHGGWRPFATLRAIGAHRPPEPALRFDAVRNAPPGLAADGPLARFREPAYATARDVGRPSTT